MRTPSDRASRGSLLLVGNGEASRVVARTASDRAPGGSPRLVGDSQTRERSLGLLSMEVEPSPGVNLPELFTTRFKSIFGSKKESSPKLQGQTEEDPQGPIWVTPTDPFLSLPTPQPVKVPPSRYPRPPFPPQPPSPSRPWPPTFWRVVLSVPSPDVSMLFGWVAEPKPEVLSSRNRNMMCYVSDNDKPGALVGKPWCCPECKILYLCTYNLFANIPAPKCSNCIPNIENCTAYSWTITRVIVDDVRLVFPRIYLQKGILCTVYSFIAICDLLRKIRGADRGWVEPVNLSPKGVLAVYARVLGYSLGKEPRGVGRVENLLVAVCQQGVPFKKTKYYQHHPQEYIHRSLKIKCWFRIPVDEVDKIIRIIANGIPLMGLLPLGVLFRYLKAKQVYLAPELSMNRDLHAVVLHGSAYAAPEGKFYKCRNSWGDRAHGDYTKSDHGVDFEARCTDFVHYVYGFELA